MLNACREADRADSGTTSEFQKGYCLGAVLAAAYLFDQRHFCVPAEGVNNIQFVRITVRYIEDHPSQQHLQLSVLAADALARAFPCARDRRK